MHTQHMTGPKRLPDAGRAFGQGLKEFRASIGGRDSDEVP
jgi:Sec-independent protein translocase protein TatA